MVLNDIVELDWYQFNVNIVDEEKPMAFRQEYIETLKLLGKAFHTLEKQGYPRPVIVGGAAVEYYTGGEIVSGDFDIIYQHLDAFKEAVESQGFTTEDRFGHLLHGFYHKELLTGIELVSGSLFDGKTDSTRMEIVAVDRAEDAVVSFPPIEDLIADRMGQYEADTGRPEMLEQARILYQLAENIDLEYLEKRLKEELVDYSLAKSLTDE